MGKRGPDPGDRKRNLRKGVGRAVTGSLNLAVVGASGVGAAALGSWPILALGGAAYAALVAWDLSNPKFWAKVLGTAAPEPVALPQPEKLAAALRPVTTEIRAARQELERVLATTPPEVAEHLGGTLTTAAELERRAAELLARGDTLQRYLDSARLDEVRAAVAELERKLGARADAEARAQYQRALEARQEHLRTLEQIAGAVDRLLAHLTRVAALLSALPPKVIHLGALDAEAMDRASGAIERELDSFTVEIASFEETLETLTQAVT